MRWTQVTHDGFARQSLMRAKIENPCECAWCGSPARWVYGVENDGINTRVNPAKGAFCSIGCFRDYHVH